MPTFKVTDPVTGRVVKLTGDSAPNEQELEQIFAQIGGQDKAIAEQPSRPPAGIDVGEEQPSRQPVDIDAAREQALRKMAQETGALGAIGAGFEAGARTLQRAVGLEGPQDEFSRRELELLKESRPVSTGVGEILGESAPFLGLGIGAGAISNTGLRIAAAAGLGALEAGAVSKGRGSDVEDIAKSASLGAAVAGTAEAVLPSIVRVGSSLVRRVFGRNPNTPILDSAGNISDELSEALSRTGITPEDLGQAARKSVQTNVSADANPEESIRKAFLEQEGVVPTQAQITRGASDFQEQQELAKVSTPVRERLGETQKKLTQRFEDIISRTGGEEALPSSTITDSIINKTEALDTQITDLYRKAREAAPTEKNVRLTGLTEKLRSKASQNRVTGGVVEAIVGDLKEKGVLKGKGLTVTGKIDTETAEDVRKLMNELFDPTNSFRNSVLGELKEALDEDVLKVAGEDVFKQARKAKADFEKGLNRAKISKFDSRKANLVRDIRDNKIDPNRIVDDVVFSRKWRAEDLQQLKTYVSDSPEGVKAFDDLRADTLRRITDKTFTGPQDAEGFKALNINALQKSLSSLGKKKMDILFNKEEQKFLNKMMKVGKTIQPVSGTALGKGPSAQAIKELDGILNKVPFIGDAIGRIKVDRGAKNVLRARPSKVTRKPPIDLDQSVATTAGLGAELGKQIEELQDEQ